MTIVFFILCLVILPAALTWGFVRLAMSRSTGSSRARILVLCVPPAALLPLLPGTAAVMISNAIFNPVLIALMATLIVGAGVALCICLPVGLALTRHLGR